MVGFFKKLFGKNAMTSVLGVVSLGLSVGGVLVENPKTQEKLMKVAGVLMGSGLMVAADGRRVDAVEKKTQKTDRD